MDGATRASSHELRARQVRGRAVSSQSAEEHAVVNVYDESLLHRVYSMEAFHLPDIITPTRRPPPRKGVTPAYHHRDPMSRIYNRQLEPVREENFFLSPEDASLVKLVVQSTNEIRNSTRGNSWERGRMANVGPSIARITSWVLGSMLKEGEPWDGEQLQTTMLKWLPASVALSLVFLVPSSSGMKVFGGNYPPFPYRYWGYPKTSRNKKEDRLSGVNQLARRQLAEGVPEHDNVNLDITHERLVRPRYLCSLKGKSGFDLREVTSLAPPPYLFVSYTSAQFSESKEDLEALVHIAETATRQAGLCAFWIGCSCLPNPAEIEQDIYRINDVIRGAHALAIILGPQTPGGPNPIQQWGNRMWVFPEVILSPRQAPIKVYTRGSSQVSELDANALISHVWKDDLVAKQLIDHYAGTLILSRLELVAVALKCLHKRNVGREHLPGDLSYALMGLLRRRPRIDGTDSAFQALARLSLANDSDMLVERMICMLPKEGRRRWLTADDDAWGANLWDVYPSCQVAGIERGDKVVLDGCYAASIKWNKFERVRYLRRVSWKRRISRIFLRLCLVFIFIGAIIVWLFGKNPPPAYAFLAALFIATGSVTLLASPYLVKVLYGGKFWASQPWLFAFEGYLDIGTIEYMIFGYNHHRLSWSKCGSPLSRHSANPEEECVGRDPTDDRNISRLVRQAKFSQLGQHKVFTLVDTNTMTVTLFSAARPPVAMLVCGSEGGMQRAALCSYDSKSQTLYRETVARVETTVLEKMSRIGRVKFGFYKRSGTEMSR